MSGLATIFRDLGFRVVGTDPRADTVRDMLRSRDISVFFEQDGSRIPENAGLVVASAALSTTHPELMAAARRGIPVISYAKCIGLLMSERRGVAVAGTHGKTTVTSMIVSVLKAAEIDPGFVIGGQIPALGSGAAAGSDELFVAEACEYNRSFLNFYPDIAVITGIEADHLDVYGTLDNVKRAFFEFASHLPAETGKLVFSAACPNTAEVIAPLTVEKISFGIEMDAEVAARRLSPSPQGTSFELWLDGSFVCNAHLSVPGRHNVANALAAVAVLRIAGIEPQASVSKLQSFQGARRRFELRGDVGGITVIDDYAHHPTELGLLLSAARERFPGRRIVLAFQPHQYSRTLQLMDAFAAAIDGADEVLIPNVYYARDIKEDVARFDPQVFKQILSAGGTPVSYLGTLDALRQRLLEMLRPEDVLITAGAGDIDTIIEPLLTAIPQRNIDAPKGKQPKTSSEQ